MILESVKYFLGKTKANTKRSLQTVSQLLSKGDVITNHNI